MLVLIEIINFSTTAGLLLEIPESAGLLAFGVGLTASAAILRSLLGRGDADRTEETQWKKIREAN